MTNLIEVPFVDLKAQFNKLKNDIDSAINRVTARQLFILGEELRLFEEAFARYLGIDHVLGVGSGTDALILSLLALDIGPGCEVIVPVNSFVASSMAVSKVGAIPVFVDVDPDTYLIDVQKLTGKITEKTKAIMPVHLYGAPCDMISIDQIARRFGLRVIEDACQAHGSTLNGRKMGTWGDISAFSFYPTKNLGAYGDGGAIATNDPDLAAKVKLLRNYGESQKYNHVLLGQNSRLDELQAAILRVKLAWLDEENHARHIIAQTYRKMMHRVKFQTIPKTGASNYHLFIIESSKRDNLMQHFQKYGIQFQIHYPIPLSLQKCHKDLGYKPNDFPIAENAAHRILSLPISPYMKQDHVSHVISTVNEFAKY